MAKNSKTQSTMIARWPQGALYLLLTFYKNHDLIHGIDLKLYCRIWFIYKMLKRKVLATCSTYTYSSQKVSNFCSYFSRFTRTLRKLLSRLKLYDKATIEEMHASMWTRKDLGGPLFSSPFICKFFPYHARLNNLSISSHALKHNCR